MRTVAVVQARMGSTRLPGKSAMLIQKKPLVWHVLRRVIDAEVDEVVLALPKEPHLNHESLVKAAVELGALHITSHGAVDNLVERHILAATLVGADTVVRVPGDNPCVDPDEINRIVNLYAAPHGVVGDIRWLWSNLDQNIDGNGYPGGLGAEVYSLRFLKWLQDNVVDGEELEHPHRWAFHNRRVFTLPAPKTIARPDLRFDVNTRDDLQYIRKIYAALYPKNPNFRTKDILKYLGEQKNGQCVNLESNYS